MRKHIILMMLFFSTLLLTGCTVNYKAAIYSSKRIVEQVEINITTERLSNDKKEAKNRFNEELNNLKQNPNFSGYSIKGKFNNRMSTIKLVKVYNSLSDYGNSLILKGMFENITVIENKEYFLFQTTGRYYHDNIYGADSEGKSNPENADIANVSIKIQIANRVLENNADIKNNKNNTFTWNLKPDETVKSINFKYSHQKRFDVIINMFIVNNLMLFIVLASLFVFIILGLVYIIIKSSAENAI